MGKFGEWWPFPLRSKDSLLDSRQEMKPCGLSPWDDPITQLLLGAIALCVCVCVCVCVWEEGGEGEGEGYDFQLLLKSI